MKKHFFFAALVAASMLASCSSDDVVASQGDNAYGMVEGQPAFLSLGIAMPDAPASRANDNFDDGDATEYAVNSGTLVLFKGATEATATIFGVYPIDPTLAFDMETSNTQITNTSKKFVQEINSPHLTGSEKLFAYVILNPVASMGQDLTEGTPFTDFCKQVYTKIGIDTETKGFGGISTGGLVMTNVPVASAHAGSDAAAAGTVCTTLAPINATAVYDTKKKAEDGTEVACVYVERAAAKVQVKFNASINDPSGAKDLLDPLKKAKVKLEGWSLGNTNVKYYNTRQVDNSWLQLCNEHVTSPTYDDIKYRFASKTPLIASGHDLGYRTYWAEDVNYDGKDGLTNTQITDVTGNYGLGSDGVTYTFENTFNEDSQIYANTTYVGFKTTLNNGATFYTIDGANNTAYLTDADIKTKIAADAGIAKAAAIEEILQTIKSKVSAGTTITLTPDVTLETKVAATGKKPYTVSLKMTVTGTGMDQATVEALEYTPGTTVAEKLAADLGFSADVVNEYTDGVTYYATRIAHFGDVETPWSAPNEAYNQYANIYPTDGQSKHVSSINYGSSRKAAWLGRWGVVRNNWYELTVTNITGIGDAVPVNYSLTNTGDPDPEHYPGDTPDDNPQPQYYVAAHIHILPWVKRSQSVTL